MGAVSHEGRRLTVRPRSPVLLRAYVAARGDYAVAAVISQLQSGNNHCRSANEATSQSMRRLDGPPGVYEHLFAGSSTLSCLAPA